MNRLTSKEILLISLMLFSMLFGAGNLIFPAYLGQAAGESVWQAVTGFIISDVGLTVLAFIAIAKSGTFEALTNRVHPIFALLFPMAIYLSIGPGLAIPRAGSLAYEMGVKPFLPNAIESSPIALLIYTTVFFSIVFWFAKSPSKLVDRFGKILTPSLLVLILIVFIKAVFTDLSSFKEATLSYKENPISQGFLDGYQTMDSIGALIYGIIFTNIFKSKKITKQSLQVKYLAIFGLICGLLLSICYFIIGYLGASASMPGKVDNGAIVLSTVLQQLFGQSGTIVLGLIFTLACLCVCIGLITSCAQYFSNIFPKLSYIKWAIFLCVISGFVANLGLSQILKVSIPVLSLVYPMAISLIILGLVHERLPFNNRPVYFMTIGLVGLFSLIEIFNSTFLNGLYSDLLSNVPLQNEGFGWVIPGLLGLIIGSIFEKLMGNEEPTVKKAA
ncbi:LIVCS family branched-chain amino acid:cation transporter [Bacillus sp. SORGH_AS 510]|uniref:branched-chain amino acid transport system II carrier protein n=1 Tax=Bacillus sp. SORGH_AS_0510 TaxID=3041771 RepID=UPI00278AA5D2|nr:branched-chain amino acid transport system II carrier protein [Bacillus sp. SORGH_AS_0510]MDQ1147748.1 LIVCS family branched-chain amino acid:cation transporter [Bacillus sp. SORGH_AS_0510]